MLRGAGMTRAATGSTFCVLALVLGFAVALAGCASGKAQDVRTACADFRELLAEGNTMAAYARLSGSTRALLDEAARSLEALGIEAVGDGATLFELLSTETGLVSLMSEPGPVFMLSDTLAEIELYTPGNLDSSRFLLCLEDGVWRPEMTAFFLDRLRHDLQGTGADPDSLLGLGEWAHD
ncbi:hypothetical protein JW921_11035 [Candidatus Fermentibacterales bacterium]|nr:hypothetical protein [Candidatus Fermentibacterales bacterium]